MNVVGIIPCRYNSSRFPGKSLALIAGKPMMWHVYQRCLESKVLDYIYIATDDIRIEAKAKRLGMPVIMTQKNHLTGTEKVRRKMTSIVRVLLVGCTDMESCTECMGRGV